MKWTDKQAFVNWSALCNQLITNPYLFLFDVPSILLGDPYVPLWMAIHSEWQSILNGNPFICPIFSQFPYQSNEFMQPDNQCSHLWKLGWQNSFQISLFLFSVLKCFPHMYQARQWPAKIKFELTGGVNPLVPHCEPTVSRTPRWLTACCWHPSSFFTIQTLLISSPKIISNFTRTLVHIIIFAQSFGFLSEEPEVSAKYNEVSWPWQHHICWRINQMKLANILSIGFSTSGPEPLFHIMGEIRLWRLFRDPSASNSVKSRPNQCHWIFN